MVQPQGEALVDQLETLARAAMQEATPLMAAVATTLESDPRRYVSAQAGLKLLRASVLLHRKTADVSLLIHHWGVEAVADAFITLFDRPIIEGAQIAAFGNVQSDAGWAAFSSWARLLWDTVESQPLFTENVPRLTHAVFNHDKGYNRATNFAAQPVEFELLGPPALSDVMAEHVAPAATTGDRALWMFQVLSKSGLIPEDSAINRSDFSVIVDQHRQELQRGMGVDLTDEVVVEMADELERFSLVQ